MTWADFRAAMPTAQHWAFLDHAAVAPLPAPAVAALRHYADDLAAHGVTAFRRWADRIAEVRGLFGRLLNCDPLDVAFVKNTSEGIGLVAEGIAWQPGDNVVFPADEYPANQYPWLNLARRGVECRRVPSRDGRVELTDLRDAMTEQTRVLSVSSVQFASGFRLDLDAVGELCRQRGVFFFVDAIQSLGVFPLDVRQTPIDALAADGHKWLLGPEGAGILYVRREALNQLQPVGIGWNSVASPYEFSTIDFRLKPHAGRYESGSHNVPGVTAFGAAVQLLLDAGIPNVAARVLELTDEVCARASAAGWDVFSSRRPGEASGIVSLTKPGADPHAVMRRCLESGVAVNVRGGRLRVSPHCYNTSDDLARLSECLR